MMFLHTLLIVPFCLGYCVGDASWTSSKVTSIARSNGNSTKVPQFYTVYMADSSFNLTYASVIFVKVPGVSFAFNHPRPFLYRIRLQGNVATAEGFCMNFVRI